jgi:hypothetical protein
MAIKAATMQLQCNENYSIVLFYDHELRLKKESEERES